MFGRLFFPVGKYDDWQVGIYLYGKTGTGKSKIVNLISKV